MYFQYLTSGVDFDAGRLAAVRLTGPSEVGLRAAYGAAMRREYEDMPISRRNTREYTALRRRRRDDLETIIRRGMDASNKEKALDLIGAICAEPAWAENIPGPFDDDAHPTVDFMAANTACLMAWALHEGGFDLNVRSHVIREVRRRVFMPLIAHDDYACLRPGTPRALSVMCLVMTAAVLMESDTSRLIALLRRTAPAADEIIAGNVFPWPMKDCLADWTEATAFWQLTRLLTGHQPMTRALPVNDWLDALLIAHLGDGVFADRFGGGFADDINGADVYLLGRAAGDDAVKALGAALYREREALPDSLNARLMADYSLEMISDGAAVPRFRHGALNDAALMCARGSGMCVTMHTGGRGNAGGFCAYLDGDMVMHAMGPDNMSINDMGLENVPGAGDCDFDDERADMSVDMTPALPRDSGVRFMQRTVMLERATGTVRMIDMVECVEQGSIEYMFDSPCEPVNVPGGAVLGRALLTWDGDMEPRLERTEKGCRIALAYRLRPGSNMLNFILDRA